jgi:hypothetical protein
MGCVFPDVPKECSAFILMTQEVTQSHIPEDLNAHIIYPLHGTESCNPFRSTQQYGILNIYEVYVISWTAGIAYSV